MVRWGIIGCGKIAGKFAEDLNKIEGCVLYGVASRSIDKAITFAKVNNAQKAFGSYEELTQNDQIDVVYIATPHPFHKDNTILCLQNGKHVLCEKPFAMNIHEVKEMVNAAKKNERFLMEAVWTQFFPVMHKVRELVNEGQLGEIKMIEADFGFKADVDLSGRLYNPYLGGGALLDIGIYPIFLCHSLLGKPDEITANAVIGSTGVDVSTVINLKWQSGALASLNCTILTDTKTVAKIYGDKAYLEIDSRWHESKSMSLNNRMGRIEEFKFEDDYRGYAYEIMEVNKCLTNNKTESELLPLQFSVDLIETLDTVRSHINLAYPSETKR